MSIASTAVSMEQLESKLRVLKEKDSIPNALLELVARTALLQREARKRVEITLPAADIMSSEDHEEGDPLLERRLFPYDKAVTAQVFGALLGMLCAAGGELTKAAEALRGHMETGEISIEAACNAVLRSDERFFANWAERIPQSPSMVRFLALGSLMPSVEAVVAQLAERHNHAEAWPYGHCPMCGSDPLMGRVVAVQEGELGSSAEAEAKAEDSHVQEGQRQDTCSFCRHSYASVEEQCPYCLNRGPDALTIFTADSAPTWHVHVCNACHSYMKVVDYTAPHSVSIPVLDDLETLVLDMLAGKQDLKRPTPSAWGF